MHRIFLTLIASAALAGTAGAAWNEGVDDYPPGDSLAAPVEPRFDPPPKDLRDSLRSAPRRGVPSLADPDAETRMAAVRAAAKAKGPKAEALLESVLRLDAAWWVRYAACTALGRFKGDRARILEALSRAAREDAKPQVRLQATLLLGEFRGAPIAEALAKPLSDSDPGVRIGAALSLANVGGRRSASLLRAAWEVERIASVRRTLLVSLRRVVAPRKSLAKG